MNDKNKPPSMRDFGLTSFVGNAPEWSEQYQKQEKFVEALEKYEQSQKENKTTQK